MNEGFMPGEIPARKAAGTGRMLATPRSIALGGAFLLACFRLVAEQAAIEQGWITGDRVNVRGRPLPTAELCCQLEKGDPVEIIERRLVQIAGANTEEWVRIVLPQNATVWVQSGLVSNQLDQATITTRANGRAGPSLMWPVLCVYSKGDSVTIKTNHADWVGVVPTRNASAWVSGRYVGAGAPDSVPAQPVKKRR